MNEKSLNRMHYLITFVLIFGFRFLPPFGAMTPYGMGVLGTFIGVVYGWTFIDMIWPSFMALIGLGLVVGMPQLLAASFGSPVITFMLAMLPMMALLSELKITEYLANLFLTNRLSIGRPWVAIGMLLLGAFATAFINPIISIVIFGSFVVNLCKNLEIAPYSKLPTALLLGLSYALMNGQIIFPFMGTGLTFNAAYMGMFGESLPYGSLMAFLVPMGVGMTLLYLPVMRFIIRVDVSPLQKMTAETVGEKVKMTRDQKLASALFVAFIITMLLMSVLPPTSFLGGLLSSLTMFGIATLFLCLMIVLRRADGTPLLNYRKMAEQGMSYDVYLLTTYIIAISVYLTKPETGVGASLGMALEPMTQLPPMIFIIVALVFAAVITNFANNVVLAIIMMPAMVSFANLVGMNAPGLVCLLFFVTQLALATPGASPITGIAMSHSSIVKPKDMMKMAVVAIPALLIITIPVGLVWMNIVF